MMIELYPSAMLRQECSKVDVENHNLIENVCIKMEKVILDFEALGLAANQIGIDLRIVGIKPSCREKPFFLVNPKITERSGIFIGDEACLSFPGVSAKIKRNTNIKVKYWDLNKKEKVEEEYFAEEAVIIQHEIDHINGITLAQSVSGVLRQKLLKDLKVGKKRFFKALSMEAKLRRLKNEK